MFTNTAWFRNFVLNMVQYIFNISNLFFKCAYKGGGADVLLFEIIKTNAGTQPIIELQ